MSKFAKALAQAEHERALRVRAVTDEAPPTERRRSGAERDSEDGAGAAADRTGAAPGVEAPADPISRVDEHLVTLLAPTSFEAEQYLAPRHFVEQVQKEAGVSLIAVSSPGIGDGKTITAINLAGALAQEPRSRVLLVDADLRHPSVGARLGMDDEETPGLAGAVLNPALSLEDVVRHRAPFNLAVLLAGQRSSKPYELLKSPRLGDLLGASRRHYDFVVLDTPPLIPLPDCRAVARWADGVLVVVRAHRTARTVLVEALDALDGTKVLGLVWNNDDPGYASRYAYAGHADGRGGRRHRRAV